MQAIYKNKSGEDFQNLIKKAKQIDLLQGQETISVFVLKTGEVLIEPTELEL